jgi:hypothetical protein
MPEQTSQVQLDDAQGVISGGWPYIWGAYSLTWVLLAGYAVSLFVRAGRARRSSSSGGPS